MKMQKGVSLPYKLVIVVTMVTISLIGIIFSFYLAKLIEFNSLRDRFIATKGSLKRFLSKTESINVSLNLILMKNKGYNLFYLKNNSDTDLVKTLMDNMERDINGLSYELASLNRLFALIIDEKNLEKFYKDPIKKYSEFNYRSIGDRDGISIYEAL